MIKEFYFICERTSIQVRSRPKPIQASELIFWWTIAINQANVHSDEPTLKSLAATIGQLTLLYNSLFFIIQYLCSSNGIVLIWIPCARWSKTFSRSHVKKFPFKLEEDRRLFIILMSWIVQCKYSVCWNWWRECRLDIGVSKSRCFQPYHLFSQVLWSSKFLCIVHILLVSKSYTRLINFHTFFWCGTWP